MARNAAEVARIQQETQLQQNRITTAEIIGRKYGVNPQNLMNLDSPRSMEQYAMLASDYNKKNQEFSKRISLLEKTRVPEQHFAGGGAGTDVSVTADNVDSLWLQHERNYPGQANPYEEQMEGFEAMDNLQAYKAKANGLEVFWIPKGQSEIVHQYHRVEKRRTPNSIRQSERNQKLLKQYCRDNNLAMIL